MENHPGNIPPKIPPFLYAFFQLKKIPPLFFMVFNPPKSQDNKETKKWLKWALKRGFIKINAQLRVNFEKVVLTHLPEGVQKQTHWCKHQGV